MTPDNAGYFYAAYVATAIIYVLYAVSIGVRLRKVRNRQRTP